ncbi:replicative DNA helicase [Caviibacterium pharyngocola]|uniref:Replicative DNA helicase n=1 Tax=Caviibacterium pharyngocola TaxID=28159 RepID=A0A2M8RSR8_9PAST|nr:replicative DNA helicase [Caviibacterium pharyngocola]PJG81925.1 replicative DNA helicase [Caviibacterium pharyngocola]
MKQNVQQTLYSVEAETALLGGLVLNNSTFDEISTLVQAKDFFIIAHSIIFSSIKTMILSGRPVDILTLEQYLKEQGKLTELGGLAYIAEIIKNTPSTANVIAYAEIIQTYSQQRQLLKLGQDIIAETQKTKGEAQLETLMESIEKRLTDITLKQDEQSETNLNAAFDKIIQKMEDSMSNHNPVSGTPTGIQAIDEITTGGQAGDFIVIGARPSMGKTAFSQNIAYHTLEKFTEQPVFYFSLEMPADQLLQRFTSMISRVGLQRIRQAKELFDDEWAKISEAMGHILKNWQNRLIIDDEGSLTTHKLRIKTRKYSRKYGKPAAIIIDYLQLMSSSGRYENRNLEISAISRALKELAKEIDCPIYALSQLNRKLEDRGNKRPVNSDLRESGSLEQDADTIFFIYRDEVYNKDTEFKGLAEIIIGKQRNGPLGNVMTRFMGEYSIFENMTGSQLDC